jgi:hypothetical protein
MHPSPVAPQILNLPTDVERLVAAHQTVRAELLGERTVGGHWVGELSSSPLATAAAVSALVIAHSNGGFDSPDGVPLAERTQLQNMLQGGLSELIVESLHWLAGRQNVDASTRKAASPRCGSATAATRVFPHRSWPAPRLPD